MVYKAILSVALMFAAFVDADVTTVSVVKPESNVLPVHQQYFPMLLDLVLQKTVTDFGAYEIRYVDVAMEQVRIEKSIENNKHVDIMWTMSSDDRNKRLLPVRFPLLKGTLGYRIFLINRDDQEKFSSIKTKEDLLQYTAGQGVAWPDVDILKMNGVNVIQAPEKRLLFNMLSKRRFDYFPRGINEIWDEAEVFKNYGLIIEKSLMIHYMAPMYFYVNKGNLLLADRLEVGLWTALNDGSFDELFFSHPEHEKMFNEEQFRHRKIFKFQSPYASPSTGLLNDSRLWYVPGSKVRRQQDGRASVGDKPEAGTGVGAR